MTYKQVQREVQRLSSAHNPPPKYHTWKRISPAVCMARRRAEVLGKIRRGANANGVNGIGRLLKG